jgi:hypothetical protein
MGLKEALDQEPEVINQVCRIYAIKKKMSAEDKKVLEESLLDPEVSTAGLCRALKKEGFSISIHAIGRHRRGDCICHLRTH